VPVALPDHVRVGRPDAVDDTHHVDVHDPLPVIGREVLDRAADPDSRVVEDQVDPAVIGHHAATSASNAGRRERPSAADSALPPEATIRAATSSAASLLMSARITVSPRSGHLYARLRADPRSAACDECDCHETNLDAFYGCAIWTPQR
jgi:hypothetical protein